MDNNQKKLINILSMAACANKIISGDFAIDNAADKNMVKLIIIAADTAEKTRLEYNKIAMKYNIPVFHLSIEKEALGKCIGKNERAAAAVCDEGFAKAINKILK